MVIETLGKIMSEYWKDVKKLSEFRLDTISEADLEYVRTRIIMLNTKSDAIPATYLVTAFPIIAKEKTAQQGLVVMTWPEVVIGIISETKDDGNQTDGSQKSWALRPTRKDGRGWRKNSIMRVRGRDYAARLLIGWWAEHNRKEK
jgi:hypothetical protein